MCNLRYKIPNEIPVVFHNGSTFDYHFIIKELVKEFDGNFECLGENTKHTIVDLFAFTFFLLTTGPHVCIFL